MGSKKRTKNYSSSDSSDSSDSDSSRDSKKRVPKKSKKSKASDSESESKQKKHASEEKIKYKHRKSDNETKSRDNHGGDRDRQDYRDKDRPSSHSGNYKDKDYYASSKHRDYENYERKRDREDDRVKYNRDERDRDFHKDRNYDRNPKNTRDSRDQRGNSGPNFRSNRRSRSKSFDHASAKWGRSDQSSDNKSDKNPVPEKQKPNFGLSGKLTEETNTYRGFIIKYSEPPEARKPKRRWRLYPFKGEKALQTLYIHRESAYLIGRERKIVDLPVDHPSCSKQHAALQYRLVPFTREDGSTGKRVRPYLIDLDSANGTFINNKKIEPKKYVELLEKDVIKFGFSSREYVLLHENSKDEAMDDDVKQEEEEVKVKIKKEEID